MGRGRHCGASVTNSTAGSGLTSPSPPRTAWGAGNANDLPYLLIQLPARAPATVQALRAGVAAERVRRETEQPRLRADLQALRELGAQPRRARLAIAGTWLTFTPGIGGLGRRFRAPS